MLKGPKHQKLTGNNCNKVEHRELLLKGAAVVKLHESIVNYDSNI